jgi:succinate dehydrogenase hydrophobic anchor subunit
MPSFSKLRCHAWLAQLCSAALLVLLLLLLGYI